ncbi:MAG: N-acetylmuramidase family protein [Pseudomonadota bacterium]
METIKASVGIKGRNNKADVLVIRKLLRRHAHWLPANQQVAETGAYEPTIGAAIQTFQKTAGAVKSPDGRVDPNGYSLRRLNAASIPKPDHMIFWPLCWHRDGDGLLDADFKTAATKLMCEVAAIKAVAEVEVSSRGAWEQIDGRPTILFERHKFKKHSGGTWDRTHSDISGSYSARSYGLFREQYEKLYRAAVLDQSAALKACSYGAFQILGENFKECGYQSVEDYVDSTLDSQRKHLDAFVSFILSNAALLTAIRNKQWATFAKGYNGPSYKDNDYDTKMADAYKKFAPPPPKKTGAEHGTKKKPAPAQ